jgi:hypothetical protein
MTFSFEVLAYRRLRDPFLPWARRSAGYGRQVAYSHNAMGALWLRRRIGLLNQPFIQSPRQLCASLRQGETAVATGGLQQEVASILPMVGSQVDRRQRNHEAARISQCRDRAAVLERDRLVKLADPGHGLSMSAQSFIKVNRAPPRAASIQIATAQTAITTAAVKIRNAAIIAALQRDGTGVLPALRQRSNIALNRPGPIRYSVSVRFQAGTNRRANHAWLVAFFSALRRHVRLGRS